MSAIGNTYIYMNSTHFEFIGEPVSQAVWNRPGYGYARNI